MLFEVSIAHRSAGSMDRASDFGSEGSGFESLVDRMKFCYPLDFEIAFELQMTVIRVSVTVLERSEVI